ncbi:NADPH-dependent FMN reductase [Roseibium litorale]|uniref:NAD(P)H-dependent oxidoreductase n=1 Tax=Roseibium litorale TaxID=2803841 RepID=A0ABR9CIP7_9HYPH|nr:NADPH-dependent FMN reductase [Roseibium litorale]MBD8890514.1 NAD(P)H-dependent oxidoreductase [Roseibium litorale]
MTPIHLLAICGSLRAASSNRALLEAAQELAPEGMVISLYNGLAGLPHFSPDLESAETLPDEVTQLRSSVAAADGLLIACPEYMHCLPGSFKNMLDWLVGCTDFPGKKIALFQAASRHEYVPEMLRDVLKTMAGEVVEEACLMLPARSNALDKRAISEDKLSAARIQDGLQTFADAIRTARS